MASKQGNLCTCCISTCITLGLSILFLWLSFRTQPPKFSIHSLNTTLTSSHHHHSNTTIFFNLTLANPNKDKGVQYDAVLLSFALFLSPNATSPLANATIPGFYQGFGKTSRKWGSAAGSGGVNRTAAEKVVVRVEVATAVRYRTMMWHTKRHRFWGGANVEVNASTGEKVDPKEIRIGHVPPRIQSRASDAGIGIRGGALRFLGGVLLLVVFT